MTIGVIATVRISEGNGETFEALFEQQAEQVRKNEPANQLYRLFRSRTEPGVYTVMEIYENEDALKAHMGQPYMAENRPKIAPLLAGKTTFEIIDAC